MRILAVNTDTIVLEVLVQLLVDRPDYYALAALSVDAARELLDDEATGSFDCILIDADVAQSEKFQFMETLRFRADCADTPILVMTSDMGKDTLDAAFAAGAKDVMPKPFEISALLGRLMLLTQKQGPAKQRMNDPLDVNAALHIFDADGFVSQIAFENYAKRLSRGKHAGSATFAFAINDIRSLHRQLSPFVFHSMVNDVADIIAAHMPECQHLVAYAGAGVYMGIAEADWRPQTTPLMTAINHALRSADIADDDDQPLEITLSVSDALRLGAGRPVYETLAQVRQSAERSRGTAEGEKAPYVLMDRIA